MSYKTLIIIDDSSTVSTLNQEIVRETLKHLVLNGDDVSKIGLTTVSTNGQLIADFDDTKETKIRAIENMSYEGSDGSVKDVLMNTILSYKENDFAKRDIIIISDGHQVEDTYTTEELYFELSDGQYPVYSVLCEQETGTSDLREISSIARIGGGKAFHTKQENEASSEEIKLGAEILSVLSDKHDSESEDSENNDIQSDDANYAEDSEILVENDISNEDYYDENSYETDSFYNDGGYDASVIYEKNNENSSNVKVLLFPIALIVFLVCVVYFAGQKNKKKKEKEHETELINTIRNSIDKKNNTRCLIEEQPDDDGGTRILYQAMDGVDITLEDRADPTKYFRGTILDRIVIGRSSKLCDIPIIYDDSVSQRHCELFLREDEVYIRDLSSSNGTYVNGQKVYQEIKLNSGDIIKIGQLSLFIQIVRRGIGV